MCSSDLNATFAGQIFSGATHVTGQHTLADFGGTGINFDFTSGNIGRIASVKTSGSSTFELYTYNSGSAVKALDFSSAGNATFAGTVTPTGGIVGTTTNNNAAAGCVGEYVSSAIEYASRVSLTTSTPANVTSISLTAGDWDVDFTVIFSGASTGTYVIACINSTSAAMTYGAGSFSSSPTMPTSAADCSYLMRKRVSISSTTTYYGVAEAGFSVGSPTAYGRLSARRVR